MHLLAELPPPTSFAAMGWVLVALAALGGVMIGARSFIRSQAGIENPQQRVIADQPLRVTPEPRYVSVESYQRDAAAVSARIEALEERTNALYGEMRDLRAEIHHMELRIINSGEDRASKIHERINVLLGAVSALKGRSDATPV